MTPDQHPTPADGQPMTRRRLREIERARAAEAERARRAAAPSAPTPAVSPEPPELPEWAEPPELPEWALVNYLTLILGELIKTTIVLGNLNKAWISAQRIQAGL